MRKAISFILTLALLMAMVMGTPIVASAEDGDPSGDGGIVYVNGIEMTAGKYVTDFDLPQPQLGYCEQVETEGTYVAPEDYEAWYDGETLYLSGASIKKGYAQGESYDGIYSETGDLTIELNGRNTIGPVDEEQDEDSPLLLNAISVCNPSLQDDDDDLTITGSGSLYVKGGSKLQNRGDEYGGDGIFCSGRLTVADSCILSVAAPEGNFYIIEAGKGIYSHNTTENEDVAIMADSNGNESFTRSWYPGTIVFKDGEVYVPIKVNGFDMSDGDYLRNSTETDISGNVQTEPDNYVAWYFDGILHLNDADFTNEDTLLESHRDLSVELAGENSLTYGSAVGNAISVDGNLDVFGSGELIVDTLCTGVYAGNNISISESVELNFICQTGLHAGGDLSISGGNITVTATRTAIVIGTDSKGDYRASTHGTLHMTDGTLSVSSAGHAAMTLYSEFGSETEAGLSQVATASGINISKTDMERLGFAFNTTDHCYYIGSDKVMHMLFHGSSTPQTPDDYDINVNGIEMSDGKYLSDTNATTSMDDQGLTPSAFLAWYKDGTLYLRGAQFNSNASLIECNGDLNIALVGDNLLTCTENDEAIDVAGNLTFTSAEDPATGSDKVGLGWEGSLTVVSSATGIETDGNLNISSGAVIVRGGECAVEIGDSEGNGTPTLQMSGGMLSVSATNVDGVAMKLSKMYDLPNTAMLVQAATSGGVIISGSALTSQTIEYDSENNDIRFGSEPLSYMFFAELPNPAMPIESGSLCWLTKSREYSIERKTNSSNFLCVRLDWRGFSLDDNSIYANTSFDRLSYSFDNNGNATFYVANEGMYILAF